MQAFPMLPSWRSPVWIWSTVTLFLLVSVGIVQGVTSASLLSTTLPSPRYGMAGLSLNGQILLFGGFDSDAQAFLNGILSFNTTSRTFSDISTSFPTPLLSPSIIWNGSHAFFFGGKYTWGQYGSYSDKIYRFSPDSNLIVQMNATLSPGRYQAEAVQVSSREVYLFGGRSNLDGTLLDQIVSYDLENDAATILPYRLPYGLWAPSAIKVGDAVYLLGGSSWNGSMFLRSDRILRFNVTTGQIDEMSSRLPTARGGMGAVQLDDEIIMFGGGLSNITYYANSTSWEGVCCAFTNQILEYFPQNDTLIVSQATLPSPRDASAAVWDGTYIYIFGGAIGNVQATSETVITNQISRYTISQAGEVVPAGDLSVAAYPAAYWLLLPLTSVVITLVGLIMRRVRKTISYSLPSHKIV